MVKKGVNSMRSDSAKKKWVWAYIYVKLVELAMIAVVAVGGGIVMSTGIGWEPFIPILRVLIYAAFAWEVVYWFYRIIFLYEGQRFRIPMTLLVIPSIPGWYSLFSELTGIQNMYMERVNAHLWVLPSFFLMIAILLFFYDYNVVSKINEKEAMQAKGGVSQQPEKK